MRLYADLCVYMSMHGGSVDADRERLKQAIEDRAGALRLRLKQVARRAEMSEANFFRIRTGDITLTPFAMAAIEDALEWGHGSIKAILAGGEPILTRDHSPPVPPVPEGLPVDPADWAAMTPEHRIKFEEIIRAARKKRRDDTSPAA